MHLPEVFAEDRREVQFALIREYPLALLITAGQGGLMAGPVPLILDDGAGGTLTGHLARDNPQLTELAQVEDCLAVFSGPQAYVSPSWYATKAETGRVVPTWNYVTVQIWGRPRVIDDAAWVRRQIGALTRAQEAGRTAPWAVEDAPDPYVEALIRGIVGVEIEIARTLGKWKVSQNRSVRDRAGVCSALATENPAMAALVAERGSGD